MSDVIVLITRGPCQFTTTGIRWLRKPTIEELVDLVAWTRLTETAAKFWLGDLLAYGEDEFGETYTQALEMTGYAMQTAKNIVWVARAVASPRRREDLSFEHHAEVAPLTPAKQTEWLAKAADDNLTRDEMRSQIRQETQPVKATFWVVVSCTSASDQHALAERLELEGRSVKLTSKV